MRKFFYIYEMPMSKIFNTEIRFEHRKELLFEIILVLYISYVIFLF